MLIFRIRYKQLGGHIHCRVFSGADRQGTFAKLGDLTFDERDWREFRQQAPARWEIIPEEMTVDELYPIDGRD